MLLCNLSGCFSACRLLRPGDRVCEAGRREELDPLNAYPLRQIPDPSIKTPARCWFSFQHSLDHNSEQTDETCIVCAMTAVPDDI